MTHPVAAALALDQDLPKQTFLPAIAPALRELVAGIDGHT
jgi:hypothetical protein